MRFARDSTFSRDPRSGISGSLACCRSPGRSDEAAREINAALSLHPVSPRTGAVAASVWYRLRRYTDAAREARAVLDREPGYSPASVLKQTSVGIGNEAGLGMAIATIVDTSTPILPCGEVSPTTQIAYIFPADLPQGGSAT